MIEELKRFYKNNDGKYYLIYSKTDFAAILRVDDIGFEALNTEQFIRRSIGDVVDFRYDENENDRIYFVIRSQPNVEYCLTNYDRAVISI